MSENASDDVARAEDFPPLQSLFPENHVLELQNYLEFFNALSNKYRFGIVYLLYTEDEMSAKELEKALERTSNGLHYHLRNLVGIGLVQNHKREQHDEGGLYSYYRLTPIGEDFTKHVVSMFNEQEEKLNKYISDEEETTDTEGIGDDLRGLLTADNSDVRRWAVASFADLANIDPDAATQAVDDLVELLDDDDRDVQVDAIQALRRVTETAPEIVPDRVRERLDDVYKDISVDNPDDYFKVKEFLEHGRQIHRLLDDMKMEAKACYVIADRSEPFESLNEVVDYYETALDLFTQTNDLDWMVLIHRRLAELLARDGNFETATTHFEDALDYAQEAGFETHQVEILRGLGSLYRHRQEWESALTLLEEAQEVYADIESEDVQLLASILGTKADVLRNNDDVEASEAREAYDDALALLSDDDQYYKSQLLLSKALIPGRQGDHRAALELLEESRDSLIDEEDGSIDAYWGPQTIGTLADIYGNLGVAHFELEEFEEAIEAYSRSVLLHIVRGNLETVVEKLDTLSTVAEQIGDTENAIKYCDQALRLIEFVRGQDEQSFQDVIDDEFLPDLENGKIENIGARLRTKAGDKEDSLLSEMRAHIQVRKARLEESPEALQAAYMDALETIDDGNILQAHQMLKIIWEEYESIEPEDESFEIVVSAGVALASCLESLNHDTLDESRETLSNVITSEDQLRRVPRILFDWLTAEERDQELIARLDDEFQEVARSEDRSELTATEVDVFQSMFWSLVDDMADSDDGDSATYEEVASPQGPDMDGQDNPLAS